MSVMNKPAAPATVARLCERAGIADEAPRLIREGASLHEVRERVREVSAIRERIVAAVSGGMIGEAYARSLEPLALEQRWTPDKVSHALADRAVEEQTPDEAVQSRITPDSRAPSLHEEGWNRAVDSVTAEHAQRR